jgi:DNA repair protein RecN (Recombination protein N)
MEHSEFEVEFTEGNYTAKEQIRVEFYISTNVGQEKKPLAKIASGGGNFVESCSQSKVF